MDSVAIGVLCAIGSAAVIGYVAMFVWLVRIAMREGVERATPGPGPAPVPLMRLLRIGWVEDTGHVDELEAGAIRAYLRWRRLWDEVPTD